MINAPTDAEFVTYILRKRALNGKPLRGAKSVKRMNKDIRRRDRAEGAMEKAQRRSLSNSERSSMELDGPRVRFCLPFALSVLNDVVIDGSWIAGAVYAPNEIFVNLVGSIESVVSINRLATSPVFRLCLSTFRTESSVISRCTASNTKLIEFCRFLRSVQIDTWNATTDRRHSRLLPAKRIQVRWIRNRENGEISRRQEGRWR